MPDIAEATEQVQTAPQPIETAPIASSEVMTQIAEAHAGGAPKEEIARLEALLKPAVDPTPAPETEGQTATQVAEAEAAKVAAAEKKEDEDEPEPPAGEKPQAGEDKAPRIHVRDPLDQAFLALRKAGKSPKEAHAAVYGKPETAPAIPEPPPVPPALAAIDTEIASHEATLMKIKEDRKAYLAEPAVFSEELAELEGKRDEALAALAKASGKRASVEIQESQRTTQRQTQEQQHQQELEAAAKDYPDLANPESAFWQECNERSILWKAKGDPRFSDVRACAEEAAKRLNLKPAATKAATPASPVAQTTPAAKPPGPAVGTRASTPAAPAKTAAEIRAEVEGRAQAAALGEKYVPGRSYEIEVEVR